MADGRVYVNTAVFHNDYKDLQRAGFEPRSHRWELAVYARNVGNQAYITGASGARNSPFAADIACRRSAQDAVQRTGATGSSSRSRFGSRNRSQDTRRAPIPPTSAKSSRVAGLNRFARRTHSKRRPRTVAVKLPFVSKKLASVVPVSSSGSIPISNVFVSRCVAVQTPAGLNRKTIVTAVNS